MTSKTAFILGHPVKHSRSPLIHGYWLDKYKIDGDYIHQDISPENIEKFIDGLDDQTFIGGNVTIPHKEAVYNLLVHLTPEAKNLRAVNTLYWENGNLTGHNTDGYGFISHLNQTAPKLASQAKSALILGAGGAARSIIASLISADIKQITIANRTTSRSEELCAFFKNSNTLVTTVNWDAVSDLLSTSDLIVNTTSLGMVGQPPLRLEFDQINELSIVYDIVYAPLETELLKNAKAAGATTIDGLGMLLHQAVPGFEKWFGVRPDVSDDLKNFIIADLEKPT